MLNVNSLSGLNGDTKNTGGRICMASEIGGFVPSLGTPHMGLKTDQLIGTYGERAIAGSDFNFDAPELGSSFPADPSPEEYQFLLKLPNLSPNCKANSCFDFDMKLLAELDPDIIIMHGYRQRISGFEANKTQIETIVGRPVVFVDASQEDPECTPGKENRCFGKSFVDVIEQVEELAVAIGIDIPPSIQDDKKRLCTASANFQEVTKGVAERGVRVMAAYLSPPPGTINYFANPVDDLVLRMLEELGLPLIHVECNQAVDVDKCPAGYFWEIVDTTRYFGDCPNGQDLKSCQDNVLYPVDFWLYDYRTTSYVTDPDFPSIFPDKAIEAGQMGYWPIGAGTVSYQHAAEILEILAVPLAKAKRLHPATPCTTGVDVTEVAHRVVSLPGGEYACHTPEFHNAKYLVCEDPDSGDDERLSNGMIAMIAVVAVMGAGMIVFLAAYARRQVTNEKQADTGTKEIENVDESDTGKDGSTTSNSIPM